MDSQIMIGYDYALFSMQGIKIPLYIPLDSHLVVVGGSGKSTSVLYWLYKMQKYNYVLYIVDFKANHEFIGISKNFAEFEDSYGLSRINR